MWQNYEEKQENDKYYIQESSYVRILGGGIWDQKINIGD